MRSAVVLIFVLAVASAAMAQRGQDASLVGVVKDASGAGVAGASVTVTSAQLIGGAQRAISESEGRYRFASLPPGTYEVTASRDGFKTLQRSGIDLPPGL